MVNNKNLVLLGIFALTVFVLSLNLASAYLNSTTVTSNSSTWHLGNSTKNMNFTISLTPWNDTTYLQYINITTTGNITFLIGSGFTNVSGNLTCGRHNYTEINCSRVAGINAPFIGNLTINVTLNNTALELNETITFTFLTNGSDTTNTTSFTTIGVDGKAPTIVTPFYQWYRNQTSIKNATTDQLTLNISLADSGIGATSLCWVDVNSTNQTFTSSSSWCNFTVGNLTGLSDGNKTINIFLNDSLGNARVNSTLVLQIDTVAPVVTHTCTPEPVTKGATLTCTCSSTDATSGVNSTGQVFTANPSTSDTGTYNSECIEFDYGGTSTRSLVAYNVAGGSSGSSGGSGGSSAPVWSTQTITEEVFTNGYTTSIGANNRVKMKVAGADHTVGVISVTAAKATIEIASDPVRVTLAPGEDAKADVNNDGYYDVRVVLNKISGSRADITITKINEQVPAEQEGEAVATTGEIEENAPTAEGKSNTWIWIVVIIVLVLIIGGAAAARKK